MNKQTVHLYDTTLRDGAQGEGISLSLGDKLKIAHLLDDFGISYIEGGWPGSNPKDAEFFRRAREERWQHTTIVAFGSTRRARTRAEQDANLDALLQAETPAVALVGKSSSFHVTQVLETTLPENLAMVADSVRYLKERGREVIYDAEHFFDGYRDEPAYALATIRAAAEAGADWVVLCDTNGGSLPEWIRRAVTAVRAEVKARVGIHTHNDSELAVANALAAVEEGCTQVQGTINGYGERCGNANLISIIPALQLKMGYVCVPESSLKKLTELARTAGEIVNLAPDRYAPYVGLSAFAHKGGIHVAAVEKVTASYEHIPPQQVGNQRRIVVSELSGRGNLRFRAADLGAQLQGNEKAILAKIKDLEHQGYQFEAADGSLEMIFRRSQAGYSRPFEFIDATVVSTRRSGGRMQSEATVKLHVAGETIHTAAEGNGPVHALDRALRQALVPRYPELAEVRLTDYKVRILDPEQATRATTRVLIEASLGTERWSTVGCSENILEASCEALLDSLEVPLWRAGIAQPIQQPMQRLLLPLDAHRVGLPKRPDSAK